MDAKKLMSELNNLATRCICYGEWAEIDRTTKPELLNLIISTMTNIANLTDLKLINNSKFSDWPIFTTEDSALYNKEHEIKTI